jgi:hypothetical protein
MRIIISEEQYKRLGEIETKPKTRLGAGADHYVVPSSHNPNIVYKVGNPDIVKKWVPIFLQSPEFFPKIFKTTGKINVDGKTYSYITMEKLDTHRAKVEWSNIDDMCEKHLHKSFQKIVRYWNELYSSVEHDKNELVNLGQIIRTENPKLYDAYQRFHYLIESVYKIVPAADIHNNQFGYDKEGVLKCLDI